MPGFQNGDHLPSRDSEVSGGEARNEGLTEQRNQDEIENASRQKFEEYVQNQRQRDFDYYQSVDSW